MDFWELPSGFAGWSFCREGGEAEFSSLQASSHSLPPPTCPTVPFAVSSVKTGKVEAKWLPGFCEQLYQINHT